MTANAPHPVVYWAQTSHFLYLTVEIEDLNPNYICAEGNEFIVEGKTPDGNTHEINLELFSEIDGSLRKPEHTRFAEFTIKKKNSSWWPRLVKNPVKVAWIKVDFNRWMDADEEEELANAPYPSFEAYDEALNNGPYSHSFGMRNPSESD